LCDPKFIEHDKQEVSISFEAGLTFTIVMFCILISPDAKLSNNLVFLVFSIATGGLLSGSIFLAERISNRLYMMTVIELRNDENLLISFFSFSMAYSNPDRLSVLYSAGSHLSFNIPKNDTIYNIQ
jgi:hypothetical protein